MIEKLKIILSQSSVNMGPPVIYTAIVDILNDPMRIAGLLLIIFQAVLTIIKIKKELNAKQNEDNRNRLDNSNRDSNSAGSIENGGTERA